ncbi:DUF2290 domain-containing protein [Mediterraneibacter gnavus]|uniref:DUF2290 domain-containing protein n=1 Tax=Mediterraneibacter gnavus TaxID=33038 RepID=UPI0036D30C4E
MKTSKIVKCILDDIRRTSEELWKKEIVRDMRGVSSKPIGKDSWEISFSGKNDSGTIVFDKHITAAEIIEVLLGNLQYTLLLYDKGLIQAEYEISNDKIIKERLVFIKKHNKIWDAKEIEEYEAQDKDWFMEEEGVPIMLRIDYAPDDHVEGDHAATHLTLSNHECCRIPMKGIVTFSEFVRFVLLHFYDIKLEKPVFRFSGEDTITSLEEQMMHVNWK